MNKPTGSLGEPPQSAQAQQAAARWSCASRAALLTISFLAPALAGCAGTQQMDSTGVVARGGSGDERTRDSLRLTLHSEDMQAIRDLIERSSDAINHQDWSLLATLLTEGATWEALPPIAWKLEGSQAIAAFLSGNVKRVEVLAYAVSASAIELRDAEHAAARSTMSELLHLKKTDSGLYLVGTYRDEFVKRNGRWLFSKRAFQVRFEDDVPLPDRVRSSKSRASILATEPAQQEP